jgi:hypothetical protein
MTDQAISPLRGRMIEDMAIRKLAPKTQRAKDQGLLRSCPVTSAPMRWLRRFTPIWATTRRGFRADRTERRIS